MRKLLGGLLGCLAVVGTAQATLIDRGGGMIYDDVLNITWLQDTNFAKTSGYDTDGRMTRNEATAWADQLVYGGFDDWRLPTLTIVDAFLTCGYFVDAAGTQCGYNIEAPDSPIFGGELTYMYYMNLGLSGYYSGPGGDWGIFGNSKLTATGIPGFGQNDIGLIKNIQAFAYWSNTLAFIGSEATTHNAWQFSTANGSQTVGEFGNDLYAWAVRDGDVDRVPEPSLILLMLAAGLGMVGAMHSRKLEKR